MQDFVHALKYHKSESTTISLKANIVLARFIVDDIVKADKLEMEFEGMSNHNTIYIKNFINKWKSMCSISQSMKTDACDTMLWVRSEF